MRARNSSKSTIIGSRISARGYSIAQGATVAKDVRQAMRNLSGRIRDATKAEKLFKPKDQEALGRLVVDMIREDTAAGRSPITGGMLARYKHPKRYPGKRKAASPVNLRLSGNFMRSLRFERLQGRTIGVRIFFATRLSELKEQGHRVGVHRQPKRPIIPLRRETFRKGIRDAVTRLIRQTLDIRKRK